MAERELFGGLRRWVRLRGAVVGAAGGVSLLLLAGAGLRLVGRALPPPTWGLPLLLSLAGWWWPRDWTWALWWAGKRLGVGGKLAAAQLLRSQGEPALLELLLAEIKGARWGLRLLVGWKEGLAALLLAGLLALYLSPPPLPGWGPPLSTASLPTPAPSEPPAEPEELPSLAAPQPPVPEHPSQEESLGWRDFLAHLYGLEPQASSSPEELAQEISAQRTLLAQLAQELSQSLPEGLSPEEQQRLLSLAEEVAREDLRRELTRLIREGDPQSAAEAREAIQAVLESGEELAAGAAPPQQPGEGEGSGEQGLAPAEPGGRGATAALEPAAGEEEAVQGEAQAGRQPGEPPRPGEEPFTGEGEPRLTVSPELEAQPGPSRAYLSPGVPGESPGTPPPGVPIPTPAEVDLTLRAQGVPPELKDLVRRYFQLIRELEGGNQ